jgi:hypothetical protein
MATKQPSHLPNGDTDETAAYDRDSEAIEPLVPVMPPDDAGGRREHRRDGTDGNAMLARSQLGHTTEYTWDVEMVEPGVPRL